MDLEGLKGLAQPSPCRIVLLVLDGLGGLPHPKTGWTELETAHTPHLDALAQRGSLGLTTPVSPGITPGSGPGHLALFGYDPLRFQIGRGVMEALGIDMEVREGDVAARGNFCTLDENGLVIDRRAGRIDSRSAAALCQRLSSIHLDGGEVVVRPVKEHRFAILLRGEDLSPELADSDPQQTGVAPREVSPLSPRAARTAALANQFIARARSILNTSPSANMVLLRGFSLLPHLPPMGELYRIRPAAIATYPMYRGLARIVGMEVLRTGDTLESELETLAEHYEKHDFFYVHVKKTDAAGEDGDFEAKVHALEEVDQALPRLLALKPEVVVVTGDHSTPALLKGHSWHSVPLLISSPYCRPDGAEFSERACARGSLGHLPATQVMPLALAHALKLTKYGA